MENKPQAPAQGADDAIARAHTQTGIHEGRQFDWKRSALASIVATVGVNAALGLPHTEHVTLPGLGHGAAHEAPVPPHLLPGADASSAEQAVQTEIQQKDVLQVAEEQWARLFSADEHAGEITSFSQLQQVTAQIEALRADGFTISSVTLEGHSSDEDDSVNVQGERTAGLGVPSPGNKNPELADKRASTFEALLIHDLQQHGDQVPPIQIAAGVEDILASDEVAQIESYAQEFGYSSVDGMIMQWNTTGNTPPEVSAYLDTVLAQHRKVVVTIDAAKEQAVAATAGQQSQQPGGLQSEHTSTGGTHKSLQLDLPAFLLLPIPLWRRERNRDRGPVVTDPEIPPFSPPTPAAEDNTSSSNGGQTSSEPIFRPVAPVRPVVTSLPGSELKRIARNGRLPAPQFVDMVAHINKLPRPHNYHGTHGANYQLGRDRGGSRRGKRG